MKELEDEEPEDTMPRAGKMVSIIRHKEVYTDVALRRWQSCDPWFR